MNQTDLSAIQRDAMRAQGKDIELTDDGKLVLKPARLTIGGVFSFEHKRHEAVQRAIEDGDPEKELWLRDFVRRNGDTQYKRNYVTVDQERAPNLIPNGGLDFVLDLILGSTLKINNWYMGPFTSNWTPSATAQSNWAGASSGPLATELANAQYDETNRQAATFGNPASSQTITTSAATTFTLSTGVSGLSMYGVTLNSVNTVAYDSTDQTLLAATRFVSPKSGLDAGDLANIGYELSASSA